MPISSRQFNQDSSGAKKASSDGRVLTASLRELCHIEEHNHGERFYRLLGQVMPEWRGVKQQLDGMAELLLNE